jgi:eukaryotic-like serine/threonine-protein kinase
MTAWAVSGYTGLRVLGSGGFGEVVLARHDATGTLVAIKYLRADLLADPGFTGMFRAEAAMLAALDDPNIVRLYEYIETPAGAAIVMELVDGVSLRQILAHQGATTAEAALVVLQGSLLGLAAAHRRGVVHRDYKPENVLIDRAGGSKLTDFGIAARAGDRPLPAGTVAYVAPEQIAGAPASPAGDVYSATATFYECLTGRPPFAGETQQVLSQHQYTPVPLDPVPEPLRPVVAAGMAKDPQWRPADAITLVRQLQATASSAYGPDWADRGRSHLGEAALLLAALWPSATAPATQATAVQRISLFRHAGGRVSPVKALIAAGVVAAAAAGGVVVANAVSHHHTAGFPRSLAGAWDGTVDQYNVNKTYPAVLHLHSGEIGAVVGRSSYPTLGCSGQLALLSETAKEIVVRETITNDPQRACVPSVTLSLKAGQNGTLTYLYLPNGPGTTTVGGMGTLRRH